MVNVNPQIGIKQIFFIYKQQQNTKNDKHLELFGQVRFAETQSTYLNM